MTTPAGLQAERTRLAWRRTTLSTVVLVMLAVTRTVKDGRQPRDIAATAVIALLWVGTLVVAQRRLRALTAVPTDPRTATGGPAVLGLLVVAMAAAALVIV
jgi:hypothetical protein